MAAAQPITIPIPNELRGQVYQTDRIMSWRKKFTDRFLNEFLARIGPRLTSGHGIQNPGLFIATTGNPVQSIGRLELPEDEALPDIEAYFYTQNENVNQDVLSAVQGTFDALAQTGGKRRKSRKSRKNKKSRKNRKTRGRK